ncbi:MAG: hypothetical protein H8E03_01495 [Pelagibacteraceae bacterium]|nr:hypothetical protein [Pelagibacteraceae bacterium]
MNNKELRKFIQTEIKMVIKENGIEDYKLPAQAERFLNKAVEAIKGANLNRKRQIAALARIVKALGLSKSELVKYFSMIKKDI